MVVSAYNYRPAGSTGYISGACVAPGNCPNEKAPYVHDFGSILNFIEWTFGQNQQPLGAPYGIGPQQYPYADYFAPDAPNSPGCNPTLCPYSLHDFFDFRWRKYVYSDYQEGKLQNAVFLDTEHSKLLRFDLYSGGS